jgi:hypothetical protein
MTPGEFLALRDAHILVTDMHGDPGYVFPVAYPNTPEGSNNAVAWATTLGTEWATARFSDKYTSWWVRVKTSYFQNNWKPQRDTNQAMLMAVTCYSAAPNATDGLPSYVQSVGGSFACGSSNRMTVSGAVISYSQMLENMRSAQWRTAAGALAIYGGGYDFTFAGSGKVTLWPALLRNGSEKAVYPTQCNTSGVVTVLFDTWMRETSDPIARLSGDAGMSSGGPVWRLSGDRRCGVRWPYRNDTSSSVKTQMRVSADRCMAQPWTGGDPAKKFAGDGMSSGMNLEWEF